MRKNPGPFKDLQPQLKPFHNATIARMLHCVTILTLFNLATEKISASLLLQEKQDQDRTGCVPGLGRVCCQEPKSVVAPLTDCYRAEAFWLPPFLMVGGSMASQKSNVDYLLEQLSAAAPVSARAMFGEYAFYCDGKVVALFCDDQLFVKPTKAGRALIDGVVERAPYPGAKPHFLIGGETWDDAEWLSTLIRVTAAELPVPKPKKKK
jgi:DNA transformation protein and related proteins